VNGHHFAAGSRAFIFTYTCQDAACSRRHSARYESLRRSSRSATVVGSGPHFLSGFGLAQRELCAVVDALLRAPGRLRIVRRRYARKVLLPGYAASTSDAAI